VITNTKHRLSFGPLDLKGQVAAAGYWMYALGEGATLGNPVPIEQSLASQLMDGSVSRRTGYGNRTPGFDVVVAADDSIALAKGQAALYLACDNPTTLLFTPPDGLAVLTRFEVVTANAEWLFDDWEELRLYRTFRVTFNCMPFGQSPEPTTDAATVVEAPAAEETVNNCDSLTGFTGLMGSTASLDTTYKSQGTGSVKLTGQTRKPVRWPTESDGLKPQETGTVELTGLSLTTPATRPYIYFDAYVGNSTDYSATLLVNGEAATFVSASLLNSSWVTFAFRTDVTATITSLRFAESITFTGSVGYSGGVWTGVPSSWAPRIDNIRRSGSVNSIARQSLRAVPVGGSARTQGSLAISHPTNGLGKVLLLTTPALATGFTPDLMKWCTDSTDTDSDSISGKVKAFGNTSAPIPFEFAAALIPSGGFQLIGVMETGDALDDGERAEIQVTASTKVGGVTISEAEHQQRIPTTGNDVFDLVDCGSITLPTTDVPAGSAAIVRLEIALADTEGIITGSFNARFQEFFLIPLTGDTALSILDCGGTGAATLGTANNRLWLDSATLATRNPSAWMGTQADRTDAYHATWDPDWVVGRWQPLSLQPPEVLLFMANTGGTNAAADLTYTKSWHGLAAE
jgi:hypothetical protein